MAARAAEAVEAPPAPAERGYAPLGSPAPAGRRERLAGAGLLALLLAAALAALAASRGAGAPPRLAAAPSALFARGRGQDVGAHDANHSGTAKSAGGGDASSDAPENEHTRGANRSEAAEPGQEMRKGAELEFRLVESAEQGCCSWGSRCDSSQGFCNANKGACKHCGGSWEANFTPRHFGGSPDAWCSKGCMDNWKVPAAPTYMSAARSALLVKVLSYNLEWWKVYKKKYGMGGSEGHLIASSGPYDFIGFQECQNPWRVLMDGGLRQDYHAYQGGHGADSTAVCAAYRKAAWEELGHGEEFVAEDGAGKWSYYGKRLAVWFRLRHRESGETVLFLVHHGPLPLGSGGRCGGHSTGYNILKLIARQARQGDAVVLVGDFNAGPTSLTVQTLEGQLARVYSGWRFGGIDHFFTNLGAHRAVAKQNLGTGGSDHDALSVTLRLGPEGETVVA